MSQAELLDSHEANFVSTGKVQFNGQIENILFFNPENGYTVAKVCSRELGNVTVVGNIINAKEGANLKFSGEWANHPKYGRRIKITNYEREMPTTVKGIQKLLASGFVKGIREHMAKLIVTRFGINTLEILDKNSERLLEISGIGEIKLKMIQDSWKEQMAIQKLMVFMAEFDISIALTQKIYRKYGDNTIEIVKTAPYRLGREVTGIGFLTADHIAMKLGFDKACPMRIQEGLVYVLFQMASNGGHVFAYKKDLLQEAVKLLQIEEGKITHELMVLVRHERIVIDKTKFNEDAIYLKHYWNAEKNVASKLGELLEYSSQTTIRNIDAELSTAQRHLSITLATKQIKAVRYALEYKVSVITGGPGTGKTTIIKTILSILSKYTKSIFLAAPTGRAAKRMSEATGHVASTIHRMLGFNPEKDFENVEKIKADVLILDEASMIDLQLMSTLLDRLPEHIRLIIVGDSDQLPSVGAGCVLKNIIDSEAVPVARLNEIFRQAAQSRIIVNAHKIISGQIPEIDNNANTDFFFFRQEEPETIRDTIIRLVKSGIPEKFGYDSFSDIQVLAPMRKGIIGTDALNVALQEALNPNGEQLVRNIRQFRVGDKVMQVKNNYQKNVFNGDIGVVCGIDRENQNLIVDMGDQKVEYDFSDLDELVLSYAATIHKSQGSEFPVVVIPISTQHFIMLQRNLLYTGVTRGKKMVILVGTSKALAMAIRNNKIAKRNSMLAERLQLFYENGCETDVFKYYTIHRNEGG